MADVVQDAEFELELTVAEADWTGTRVGFSLSDANGKTRLDV